MKKAMSNKNKKKNIDKNVVRDFGSEWNKFNYRENNHELKNIFNDYFSIFPWEMLKKNSVGFDMGCGTGRWARLIAPRVGKLYCIDPSNEALNEAMVNLKNLENCYFECCDIESSSIPNNSQDFGYSLGVLHHIPDTELALKSCINKLKSKAPFLAYFYYSFDNKPSWYRFIWIISDLVRKIISKSPFRIKYIMSQMIALLIYFPLARFSFFLNLMKFKTDNIPLNYYMDKSFYIMRTDALDRMGTQLEKRFSKKEIQKMLSDAGLEKIQFSNRMPFWCVVGYKR